MPREKNNSDQNMPIVESRPRRRRRKSIRWFQTTFDFWKEYPQRTATALAAEEQKQS